jgi:hypothetical protein
MTRPAPARELAARDFPHRGNIFSIVWKNPETFFHCVENPADFFHRVENFFPQYGKWNRA